MKDFYQDLYNTGMVSLRTSWTVNVKAIKKFMAKIVRVSLLNMPIPGIPDIVKSWDDKLLDLGRFGYGLCWLALDWNDADAGRLKRLIQKFQRVEDISSLVTAHGFLGGLSPLQEKLPEQGKSLWDLLVSKSPLTQLIELDAKKDFPPEWNWDFLLLLWKQKIFHHLLVEKIVGIRFPAIRKSLGKEFQEWRKEETKKLFILEIYSAFECWKQYCPWTPSLQEMKKDLDAGRLYVEEGWDAFFAALSEMYAIEQAKPGVGVAKPGESGGFWQHFSGDFLGTIEHLRLKANQFKRAHPQWSA